MKSIVIAIMLIIGVFGTCSATQWEPIASNDTLAKYIDVASIKVMTVGDHEIIKAHIKSIYNPSKYAIGYYKIDKDSKAYCLYQSEVFDANDVMTEQSIYGDYWHPYDTKHTITNEILKRAN